MYVCARGFYDVTFAVSKMGHSPTAVFLPVSSECSWHMQPTLPGCCPHRDATCWAAGEQRGTRKTGRADISTGYIYIHRERETKLFVPEV